MKWTIILLFLTLAIVQTAYADCSGFSSKGNCEFNSCYWCQQCNNNQINTFGNDRCVPSSIDCFYSCSDFCGSQCQSNSDCTTNLTDTDCYYAGICSFCKCTYLRELCPKPGAIRNGVCYYGNRLCSTSGCFVEQCNLADGQVCSPVDGCLTANNANGDIIEDYKCVGDSVFATTTRYSCNATECLYSKDDVFVERCKNGCNNGVCRDEICDIDGVRTTCNEKDGYYGGRYCVGNDIYENYRDYRCVSNDCLFVESQVRQQTCQECQDGHCLEEEQIVIVNYTYPTQPPQPEQNTTVVPEQPKTLNHPGGRLYNGFLFGSNSISMEVSGSGYINFTVRQTNNLGNLIIATNREQLFNGKASVGTFSIPFNNARWLSMQTTSSGLIFFIPAVYDVSQIVVETD